MTIYVLYPGFDESFSTRMLTEKETKSDLLSITYTVARLMEEQTILDALEEEKHLEVYAGYKYLGMFVMNKGIPDFEWNPSLMA